MKYFKCNVNKIILDISEGDIYLGDHSSILNRRITII